MRHWKLFARRCAHIEATRQTARGWIDLNGGYAVASASPPDVITSYVHCDKPVRWDNQSRAFVCPDNHHGQHWRLAWSQRIILALMAIALVASVVLLGSWPKSFR